MTTNLTDELARKFLSQSELAKRWGISPRTLERWRWAGEGLRFVKIGGLVRYRLEDIMAYEDANFHMGENK